MLMIDSEHEKEPLGVVLVTRVTVPSASRDQGRVLGPGIPYTVGLAEHPGAAGGRLT